MSYFWTRNLITRFVNGPLEEGEPSMEEFKGNHPTLPGHFIVDDRQRPILGILLPLWFYYFQAPQTSEATRIQEYKIHQIEIGDWANERFIARVTFSVKP